MAKIGTSLTDQQQNIISDVMAESTTLLAQRDRLELLLARWNQNDSFNQILNADLLLLPSTSHLTNSKIANAINAFTAILTALGDDSSGQAVNLIKLKG
jgi:hypothetical protein